MSRRPILLLMVMCLFLVRVAPVHAALDAKTGDEFTVYFSTHLSGTSGDYEDYYEDEDEWRHYQLTSINGSVATWVMTRNYTFSSSDGESYTEDTQHLFYVDTVTRRYLNSTYDAPSSYATYYSFDFIWFQIDPNVEPGDKIMILGHEYTVKGVTTVFTDAIAAFKAIEVTLPGAVDHVRDPEYDPSGLLRISFTESYYFDPTTGYFVASAYSAYVVTSVGDFEWTELGAVQEHSYPLEADMAAQYQRIVIHLGVVCSPVVLIVGAIKYSKARWRKEVDRALDIISGRVPVPAPDKTSVAPTLWDPLTLDYSSLLENPPATQPLDLAPGVFVVTEPDNRVVVVATQQEKRLENVVLEFRDETLRVLYRLALGLLESGTLEYERLKEIHPDLLEYVHPVAEPGARDDLVYEKFMSAEFKGARLLAGRVKRGKMRDEFLQEVDALANESADILARRKVLDYSLGQAPLTPTAHAMKLRQVLRFSPSSVLMVGDDDLLSISLARRGVEVTLVEIDPYTCALVTLIARSEGLPIRVVQCDLRDPLPIDIGVFDLFVADPDFTIEAFALFLSRGLSGIRTGGIGLINFEATRPQTYRAEYLLERLNVEVLSKPQEMWSYVVLSNVVATGGHVSAKYVSVDYSKRVCLAEAPYRSVMFVIRKNPETMVALPPDATLMAPDSVIYDL